MPTAINYNDFFDNEEDNSRKYWGEEAAGCIFIAKDTGRILLAKRGEEADQPGEWGTWGGKIDGDESPKEAVAREVEEETGYDGVTKISPLYTFKDGSFKYHNFLVIVPFEFTPQLNWENESSAWIEFGKWPEPMHFGLQTLIQHAGPKLKRVVDLLNKKRDTLTEVKSQRVVVGIITKNLEVFSKSNIDTHTDLKILNSRLQSYGEDNKRWRYNSDTQTVYWYSHPTDDEKEEVEYNLSKNYNYKVKIHLYIGDRSSVEYGLNQIKAHGIGESMDTAPSAIVQSAPTFSKEFVDYMKSVENLNRVGFKGGKWYPHASVEGGLPTIGYGHKIKDKFELERFQRGLSDGAVERMFLADLASAKRKAYIEIKNMFGVQVPLDARQEEILVDYTFNLGTLKGFPKLVKAVLNKDWATVSKEYKRSAGGKELGRNKAFSNRYLKESSDSNEVSVKNQGLVDVGVHGYKWSTPHAYLSFGHDPSSRLFHLYMIQTPKEEDRNQGYSKALLERFFQMIQKQGGALDVGSYTTSGMAFAKHVIERLAKQYRVRLV
jgi:8-oxo-dGTP diphosphatase